MMLEDAGNSFAKIAVVFFSDHSHPKSSEVALDISMLEDNYNAYGTILSNVLELILFTSAEFRGITRTAH
jgi:hypothetical protein